MFANLSARGTFYDISGYLIPGMFAECIGWLSWYAFGAVDLALGLVSQIWEKGGLLFGMAFVAVGYACGHLVNSLSSAVYEKGVFSKQYRDAANWQGRAKGMDVSRYNKMQERSKDVFGLQIEDLKVFDLLIRAAEYLPRSFVSGFSFLSFYGMSRSMSLLFLLAIPSVWKIAYCACNCTCEGATACKIGFAVLCVLPIVLSAILFYHQYLRFVKYYADFLGSTLLSKGEDECVILSAK